MDNLALYNKLLAYASKYQVPSHAQLNTPAPIPGAPRAVVREAPVGLGFLANVLMQQLGTGNGVYKTSTPLNENTTINFEKGKDYFGGNIEYTY